MEENSIEDRKLKDIKLMDESNSVISGYKELSSSFANNGKEKISAISILKLKLKEIKK